MCSEWKKDVYVKVFLSEARTLLKHISCHCKYKFDKTICKSNQKCNNEIWQREYKNYRTCKKKLEL